MTHEPLRFGPDLIREARRVREEAEAARAQARALAVRLGQSWLEGDGAALAPAPPRRPERRDRERAD